VARCGTCRNDYYTAFVIKVAVGSEHTLNTFAPRCRHYGTAIIGHGVDANGVMVCCANCARQGASS
jgi:hypothetical protein